MPLVVDPAGGTSDSYLTIAEADALADGDFGPEATAWGALPSDVKERVLRRAAGEIDEAVGFTTPYVSTQSLRFPRLEDGLVIPVRVKRAQYLQAAFLARNADSLAEWNSRRARGMSSFVNPDGTGGSVEMDPGKVTLSARAANMIEGLATESGATIAIIVTS